VSILMRPVGPERVPNAHLVAWVSLSQITRTQV
jgi:hypothetical protein